MIEQFKLLLGKSKLKRAVVEAGHIYAGHLSDAEVSMSLDIGKALKQTLNEMGLKVSTMLFIDDYNEIMESLVAS